MPNVVQPAVPPLNGHDGVAGYPVFAQIATRCGDSDLVPARDRSQYQDLVAAIEMGLTGLPEKSRKVFKLHRMEGWSVPEIANFLNLSEKAIQYHLTQSVKRLRVHLKNYILTVGILIIFV